jgi:hypothetical protein
MNNKHLIYILFTICLSFIAATICTTYQYKQPTPSPECYMCQFLVDGIRSKDNMTQIDRYIENVCTTFPTYDKVCDSLNEIYIPYVITSLENDYPSIVICKYMLYC